MSKKSQRIRYLIGIYNVLRRPKVGVKPGYKYDEKEIHQVIETVKFLLSEDGIQVAPAGEKVSAENA